MRVDDTASGTGVRLAVGDPLEIVLAEAPTAGYGWHVMATGEPVLRLDEDAFTPPSGAAPGAAGVHTWRYRAVRGGTAVLELHYVHLYEASPPVRRFLLRVVVG